ncbi:MAG: hypothetical protein C5B54_09195 [Acidobacteria bacterium]|nr:MAG: hypothetical protein C5B54_09195 [Acidobacteriota bacterium]
MSHHFEGEIVTREQAKLLLAAAFRDGNANAARSLDAIARFFIDITKRKRGNGFLCATCEYEFLVDSLPRALAILYPMYGSKLHVEQAFEKAGYKSGPADAIITGICERCYDKKVCPDEVAYLIEHVRQIMPDASYLNTLTKQ